MKKIILAALAAAILAGCAAQPGPFNYPYIEFERQLVPLRYLPPLPARVPPSPPPPRRGFAARPPRAGWCSF